MEGCDALARSIFCRSNLKLIQAAGDGDSRLAEGVGHLRLAQARSVIFERQLLSRIVEAEAAEAVSVSEFAEAVQLVVAQRGLEFEGNFDKCHGGIIPAVGEILMNRDVTRNHLI